MFFEIYIIKIKYVKSFWITNQKDIGNISLNSNYMFNFYEKMSKNNLIFHSLRIISPLNY